MIKTKTLLILGAGSSAPFDFPLGRGLRDRIYEMLEPQKDKLKELLDNEQFKELPPDEQRKAFLANKHLKANYNDEDLKVISADKIFCTIWDDKSFQANSSNHKLETLTSYGYAFCAEPHDSPLNLLMNVSDSDPNCYYDRIQEFREALLKSGRFSVDAFLEHRLTKFGIVGRRAIAIALRRHENPETFKRLIKENKNNWYELLVEALIEDVPFEEFSKLSGKNLKIVTFNYDRSLEYYLHESLIHNYGITSEEAAEKINEIDIIHVHGKLGDLPWQKNPVFQLSYDTKITPTLVGQMANNIKIIPTATIDTPEFEQARELIKWADRIFILGFGFNKQNLERLRLGPLCKDSVDVNGTGMGLRFRDLRIIRELKIPNLTYPIDKRIKESWNRSFHDTTIYDFLWNDIDLTE